jgi:hypothetical protein
MDSHQDSLAGDCRMTADSNSASPSPEDDIPPTEPDLFIEDGESIDLDHPLEAVEEGASALSFSGHGGPRNGGSSSGGSSSGVRSWDELVRETATDSDSGVVHYGTPLAPDADEAASDKDLLREVLAGEPPPSDIILKDPSNSYRALPKSADAPAQFTLPPDLAATRPGDSSILSHSLPTQPGQSGIESDVWGPPSSGVDLLRPGPPSNLSGDSMQPTDEVSGPPIFAHEDSAHAVGEMPSGVGHDESSAVDLGAHGPTDLPFPLGVDSSVQSARMSRARKAEPPSHGDDPESGTVDLLAGGEEFDLGLSDVSATPSWEAAREDMPPTVPMVPAGKARLTAWAGGGAAGLLAGVAACAGIWFAGLLPNQSAKTAVTPNSTQPLADIANLRAQIQSANQARDEEAKKSAAATEDVKRVRDQLAQATAQVTQAKTAAAQAKAARDRADALAVKVKEAEAAQVALKDSIDTLTAGKTAADAKLREVDATLAAMRDRLGRAESDAKAAKDQSEVAETARKQSAALAADLAQRLRIAPTASSAEVLAALDRALSRPASESVAAVTTRPIASAMPTPEQVQKAIRAGFHDYRIGNFAAAEHEFARLTGYPEANAIHLYYLGLAQWHLGKLAEAEATFRRGWESERVSRPPPGEVEAAFERLDRADREAVNLFRR